MRIYLLKTCDACRKALKELTEAGHSPKAVDLRDDPPGAERLRHFHAELGDALVNRRSTTWRNFDLAERAGDPVELLAKHPILMKRPVIDDGARLWLGWTAETRAALL